MSLTRAPIPGDNRDLQLVSGSGQTPPGPGTRVARFTPPSGPLPAVAFAMTDIPGRP
jgi:hypothetical protein